MFESRHEQQSWITSLSRFTERGVVGVSATSKNQAQKAKNAASQAAKANVHLNDLSSVSSPSEVDSLPPAIDEASSMPPTAIGSPSGAIGARVSHEGRVRDLERNETVHAVLFPSTQELAMFESAQEASGGAKHYRNKLDSIPLDSVSKISTKEGAKTIKVEYSNKTTGRSKTFAFAPSSSAKAGWVKALSEHMRFFHGLEIQTIPIRSKGNSAVDSPQTPAYATNEKFSSLKTEKLASLKSDYGRNSEPSTANPLNSTPLAPEKSSFDMMRGNSSSRSSGTRRFSTSSSSSKEHNDKKQNLSVV
jgi:hypothetical protein